MRIWIQVRVNLHLDLDPRIQILGGEKEKKKIQFKCVEVNLDKLKNNNKMLYIL